MVLPARPQAMPRTTGGPTPISGLAVASTVTTDDVLLMLDIHDTTMATTGTDKQLPVSVLGKALPAFVASGPAHAAGVVPDPGATAGTTRYLREDATWSAPAGGGGGSGTVSAGTVNQIGYYAAAGTTLTGLNLGTGLWITGGALNAAAGSGTVNTGTSGQVAYYSTGGTAVSGESLSALIDASIGAVQGSVLFRGSSMWSFLAPGTAGQFLQTAGPSATPSWATPSGGGGGAVTPIYSCANCNAVVNTTTPTSLFLGETIILGSRTIAANTLTAGVTIVLSFSAKMQSGTNSLGFAVQLGGVTILTGTNAAMTASSGVGFAYTFGLKVLTAGSAGTATGHGFIGNITAAAGTGGSGTGIGNVALCNPTLGTPVAVNTTVSNVFDLIVTWGTASATNNYQILEASLYLM